jgi:hypothetical protein
MHSLELGLPFQPYKRSGPQMDGCEKPNKVDGKANYKVYMDKKMFCVPQTVIAGSIVVVIARDLKLWL